MSVSVVFIYWILCCLFCTYMIPRVLFTRNLDWPKGVITDSTRRYRGYIFEETPSLALLSWFVRERVIVMLEFSEYTFKMLQIQRNWVIWVSGDWRKGMLYIEPFVGVSFKLVCCTSNKFFFKQCVTKSYIKALSVQVSCFSYFFLMQFYIFKHGKLNINSFKYIVLYFSTM